MVYLALLAGHRFEMQVTSGMDPEILFVHKKKHIFDNFFHFSDLFFLFLLYFRARINLRVMSYENIKTKKKSKVMNLYECEILKKGRYMYQVPVKDYMYLVHQL